MLRVPALIVQIVLLLGMGRQSLPRPVDVGEQIRKGLSDLPNSGGTVRVVAADGALLTSDPFANVGKPGIVEFAAGTTRIRSNVVVPSNITLKFDGRAMLSIDAGINLTINGGIDAGPIPLFDGNGSVSIMSRSVAA